MSMPFPFDTATSFWSTSLLSGTKRNSRLNLYSPFPSPGFGLFSPNDPSAFQKRMTLGNQDLGLNVLTAATISIAAIASTQQTELEYTYMSTHTHTSVLNKNQEFVLIFLNLIQWHKKHSSFPPFYTCSCFF